MVSNRPRDTALAPNSCWTCKDRRVRCDRTLPRCSNCTRVRRTCQGYGVRLSWPKATDPRRAMHVDLPPGRKTKSMFPRVHIIQTSYRDMEIYDYLFDLSVRRGAPDQNKLLHHLSTPYHPPWNPSPLGGGEASLVEYFATTASFSLVTFNQNTREFGDLLIKMAFSNDSSSSKAVLFALLALASRYRNGLQSQAVQFKTAAISELTRSAERSSLSTTEAAQHVAAGMLLCSFEIHDSSETGGQWLWYVRGVKDIIKVSRLDEHADKRFVSEMLEWVHYHDVAAQFSILHWRHRQVENIFAEQISSRGQADLLLDSKGAQLTNPARPSHRVLQFLTEIFNVLFQAFEHKDKMENYVGILTTLEGNARTIVEVSENYDAQMNNTATNPIKLYQIAILIYLARVSESISGKPRDIQGLIDKAFALLDRLWAHEHQFPLLIVGSEARTDEQRAIILNLVKRSEKNRYGRSLDCLRWGLHALWIQEDLAADQEIVPSYVDRFNAIMSKTRFIPSLA